MNLIRSPSPREASNSTTHQPPLYHEASSRPPASRLIIEAVPAVVPYEAVGRRRQPEARHGHDTEAAPHHQHDPGKSKQAAPQAPRPPTRRDGAMKRDDEGRTGKDEANDDDG